ncbi:MAG: YchJ family protein [Alphaproteobacteria bacterium]|jgi:SEC-C motif-containing protein|nr:YchJ family protein [Alphaproteobacteria bacterium]
MTLCPCSSGRDFAACCGPILDGAQAPTAEALMRARYCAFTSGNMAFLDRTLAKESQDDYDREELLETIQNAKPQGLEVRHTEGGGENDSTGMVEFIARLKVHGEPLLHHEKAVFRKEEGNWIYVDGEVGPKGPPRHVEKVGRNDPCPCGSGKKYKKCCGA